MKPLDPDPLLEACKKGVGRTLLRENLKSTPSERLTSLMQPPIDLPGEIPAGGRFEAILEKRGRGPA